jgi:hypothetical protein
MQSRKLPFRLESLEKVDSKKLALASRIARGEHLDTVAARYGIKAVHAAKLAFDVYSTLLPDGASDYKTIHDIAADKRIRQALVHEIQNRSMEVVAKGNG